ncbi:MAG: adenylate/guanylate cyclase domain-containing protein [Firmicutes bacterium]|nr:adenylate/guanylate cyclase domain-containing protein [Bacillota bacterium]
MVDDHILNAFENNVECEVALVFFDIAGFEKITMTMRGSKEIAAFIQEYYDVVIPSIYEEGGVVEKLIGDGIIAMFGEPFLRIPLVAPTKPYEMPELLARAEAAAMVAIEKMHGKGYQLRCALHTGAVFFARAGADKYEEYTMIGKPLTDLWRLEAAATGKGGIWFYSGTTYDAVVEAQVERRKALIRCGEPVPPSRWQLAKPEFVEVPGLGRREIRQLKYVAQR